MGYRVIVDPKQSTSNFASKKPKLDEETDPQTSEKGFNDLSEEEQTLEQTLILITGAKSPGQLKSFTKNHFTFNDEHFICISCNSFFKLVEPNMDDTHDSKRPWYNLKTSLKRHLVTPSH